MGRTPRELGEALTSAELTELIAYGLIEPFGQARTDDGFRLIGSLLFNSNKGSDQKPLMPEDFLKTWEPQEQLTLEQEGQALEAFFEARVEE